MFLAAARDPHRLPSLFLRATQSLRGVRGLDMGSIMVLQDGTDEKVCTNGRVGRRYLPCE